MSRTESNDHYQSDGSDVFTDTHEYEVKMEAFSSDDFNASFTYSHTRSGIRNTQKAKTPSSENGSIRGQMGEVGKH